ncbi:25S rRNA (adenine645-N1)-methyltransferase [Schaereria dolodes]|nr:25S rRNA (adenine645-N1)-methyltransferase [Schaereria dolodes]
MFTVSGWAISADALKTQIDLNIKQGKKLLKHSDVDANTAVPSKKRKRDNGRLDVTGQNLASLWEKHIEKKEQSGNEAGGSTARRKRGKRSQQISHQTGKVAESGLTTGYGQESGEKEDVVGKERYEKRRILKEKKRERKALLQADGKLPPTGPNTSVPVTSTSSTQRLPGGSNSWLTDAASEAVAKEPTGLTPLQTAMRQKLQAARFRHLNETLYTSPSDASFQMFNNNPSFFSEYHEGFRRQVSAWPENPMSGFVRRIRERGQAGRGDLESQKGRFKKEIKGKGRGGANLHDEKKNEEPPSDMGKDQAEPLPRNSKTGVCTIADLGCGDAELAQTLLTSSASRPSDVKRFKLHIHSFDLAAPSPLATVADIRSIPLADSSLDIAIFSLALMGTNWIEFIEEAWRVLRWRGECWISEVSSRFARPKDGSKRVAHSVGNRVKKGLKGKGAGKKRSVNGNASEEGEGQDFVNGTIMAGEERLVATDTVQGETDVSGFVEVLRLRGFVLKDKPELENKMFVRMRFMKGLTPLRGKGVPKQNDAGGQTWGKKKFIEVDGEGEERTAEGEARVLKPCVYKIR